MQNTPNSLPVLGVVGVGLIGGSFALNLKHHGLVRRVLGAGRDPRSLNKALKRQLIDQVVNLEQLGEQADIIMIATPVQAFAKIIGELLPHLCAHCIVTDVGSTKAEVIQMARTVFGERIGQFIPGHPIAGSHTSGPQAARLDLFQSRNVILTPLAENRLGDVERLRQLWQACGANVQLLAQAENHDAIFATVSHLPHFLAAAYMSYASASEVGRQAMTMGGTGFRDFTRIAAGSPEMWRDIFLSNKQAMLEQMQLFEQEYARVRALLLEDQGVALEQWLEQAALARRNWKEIK